MTVRLLMLFRPPMEISTGGKDFIECLDILVDSLSVNPKIPGNFCNQLTFQPLLADSLNIPNG